MCEFLLELFSEEIPANMQIRAAEDLHRLIETKLSKVGLTFNKIRTYSTPLRLTLVIDGLPEIISDDISKEIRSSHVGASPKILNNFLNEENVSFTECEKRYIDKGISTTTSKKLLTSEVLKKIVEQVLSSFPWPKSMHWDNSFVHWIRPLKNILAIFNAKIVSISFGSITAGNITYGHRFLSPESFSVVNFEDYIYRLSQSNVVLDPNERRRLILEQAEKLASEENLTLRQDEKLLNEVIGLVEWPVVLIGTIDQMFMNIPDEVLITSMCSHQKYFPLLKIDGRIANRFLIISNIQTTDNGNAIIAGNERVLRARLSDAKFFWNNDRKHTLESRLPKLTEVLYYSKLGSMADKVNRIVNLSGKIASYIGADVNLTKRAMRLSKTDLLSEMVGEFPELQGIIGRYYALAEGEDISIANAIADHYKPQGPNDRCPKAPLSIAVSLADKIDSLVGFFAINEKPTGSRDPFALRRAALGVIRLILENGLRLELKKIFLASYATYTQNLIIEEEQTTSTLLNFFNDRLKKYFHDHHIRHDLISSIFSLKNEDDLVRLLARADALKNFLITEDGSNLLIAYRRATNIVRIEEKKDKRSHAGYIDQSLLQKHEEKILHQKLNYVSQEIVSKLTAEHFSDAMSTLASLRHYIDDFFNSVTVNCNDPNIRINRLRLLALISNTMESVADFSKIEC
ncbi:MAG: glycine--tRNA ligase subunit beta [Rhodospirillaceae bacterium]|nr:glycine--tRNA ligase subunit beta [Rhodospirillaceae bacterium]